MRFALFDMRLMAYAKRMSIKSKLYTEDIKHPKNGSVLLTEEKIEKREVKVEKWNLNNAYTCG